MTFKLDDQGNLMYTRDGFQFRHGEDAMLQDLTTRLRLLKDEYLYDPQEGIDYPDLIGSNDTNYLVRSLTSEIRRDPRVSYITTSKRQERGELTLEIRVKEAEDAKG